MHLRLASARTGLLTFSAALALAAPASAAAQSPPPPPEDSAKPAKLSVRTEVRGFKVVGRQTKARAVVTARLTEANGRSTVIRKRVSLVAQRRGSCRILKLTLDELTLNLLGLHAELDKVKLDVTGNPRGGVLGKLFCRLARSNVRTSERKKAARSLSARLARRPLRPVGFTATIRPQSQSSQAQKGRCPVLELVVGPLDLDLLGLLVKLNKVRLNVFAVPGEGSVGDRFCTLSRQQ